MSDSNAPKKHKSADENGFGESDSEMNDCLSQTLSQAEEDEKKKKIDSINDYLKKLEEEKVIKQAERITKQKDEVHLKKVHRELIADEKEKITAWEKETEKEGVCMKEFGRAYFDMKKKKREAKDAQARVAVTRAAKNKALGSVKKSDRDVKQVQKDIDDLDGTIASIEKEIEEKKKEKEVMETKK